MKLNTRAKCASCRNGENDTKADVYVTGSVFSAYGEGRKIPYKAYLCKEHLEMMEEDGADFHQVLWLNKNKKPESKQNQRETWVKEGEPILFFMPTRKHIEDLKIGDLAPSAFGKWAKVTTITCKKEDINRKLFAHYYTKFGENSQVSNSMKEDELVRHAGLQRTNAELDKIEKELREQRRRK